MKCAIGQCGHCQFGPDLRLPGRTGVRLRRHRALLRGRGRSDGREPRHKPKLAVWKFASCDGCQLTLLDCEDELLALAGPDRDRLLPRGVAGDRRGPVRPLARRGLDHHRRRTPSGSGGAAQLEAPGHDRRLRHRGRHPGAAQLRRRRGVHRRSSTPTPDYISTLETSTPISAHVPVDFELQGCPIDKRPAARGDRRLPQRPPPRDRPRTASASSASGAATSA